jgi:hypothetical protein
MAHFALIHRKTHKHPALFGNKLKQKQLISNIKFFYNMAGIGTHTHKQTQKTNNFSILS